MFRCVYSIKGYFLFSTNYIIHRCKPYFLSKIYFLPNVNTNTQPITMSDPHPLDVVKPILLLELGYQRDMQNLHCAESSWQYHTWLIEYTNIARNPCKIPVATFPVCSINS